MQQARSRNIFARYALGVIAVFAVLAVLAGTSSHIAGEAEAGVVAKVTVNSTGNSDDGDCEGAPNDNVVGGDCTLYEAINAANNGIADLINFHPAVFPENDPGTIIIDSEDQAPPDGIVNNLGCLPSIQRNGITIDATGAGVIIDGDDDDDASAETDGSPEECPAAIYVQVSQNGFDFTVIGGGNLTIKQFDADGIQVDGSTLACAANVMLNACSVGDIAISGVTIEQIGNDDTNTDGEPECTAIPTPTPSGKVHCYAEITGNTLLPDAFEGGGGDGIDIENVSTANEIHLNDNIIDTEYADFSDGEEAIDIDIDRNLDTEDGIFDDDILIDISGNSLNADEDSVNVEITGDLGDPFTGDINSATIMVNENTKISSDNEEAVDIDWNGCIFKSPLVIEVDGNTNIQSDVSGSSNAVEIEVNASAEQGDCKEIHLPEQAGLAGIPPTPSGTEFAQVTVSVSDNNNIGVPAGDDGVDIDVLLCCGSLDGHAKNVVVIHVDRNEDIRGGDHGVDINTDICCYDGNTSTVTVNENDEITGQGDDGVDIHNDVGATEAEMALVGAEDGDDNIGTVEVNTNGRINGAGGEDDGVEIDNHIGAFFKGSGDNNDGNVRVKDNERITGSGNNGVNINNYVGSGVGSPFDQGGGEADDNDADVDISGNGEITGGDNDGISLENYAGSLSFLNNDNQAEGDDNETETLIDGNNDIRGLDSDGIHINIFAGGDTKGSTQNVNNLTITNNAQIEGESNDGILVFADVCCTTQKQGNENIINISTNEKIIGHSGDGVDVEVCCTSAVNRTTIADNGRITGSDRNAIYYEADTNDCVPGECTDIGLSHDLKQDGFINTVNDLQITNNLLEGSEDSGIYICCGAFENEENDVKSLIKDNTITKNADHGIEIDTSFGLNIETNEIFLNGDESDSDAGIIIHNESGIGQGENNLSENVWFEVPANHNRISQNSIYDNKGLGIDLAADPDLDGVDDEDMGVGCTPKAEPVNPNDCLPAPEFLVPAKSDGATKITGRTCSLCLVELFIADQDPADQGKDALVQFGEGFDFIAEGQADADGNFSIVLDCTLDLPPGTWITATATDKVKNTSEFSQNVPLPSGTHDCTPTPTNTVPPPPTSTTAPPVTVVVTATFTPVTPGGPTSTPSIEKMCGDVNDNGSVDAVDAQLILQYKAGLIDSLPNLPSADVNNSGEVTSVDAALVLQVEAGLIPLGTLDCG